MNTRIPDLSPAQLDALAEAMFRGQPHPDIAREMGFSLTTLAALAAGSEIAERLANLNNLENLSDATALRQRQRNAFAALDKLLANDKAPIQQRHAAIAMLRSRSCLLPAAGRAREGFAKNPEPPNSSGPLPAAGRAGVGFADDPKPLLPAARTKPTPAPRPSSRLHSAAGQMPILLHQPPRDPNIPDWATLPHTGLPVLGTPISLTASAPPPPPP